MNFIHLHVHDQYSLLDGICKTTDLVKRAKELGFKALAQTNHGNVDGIVKFYKECKKNDIKPIVGAELYVVDKFVREKQNKYHVLVLAKNFNGFKSLMKALTIANQEQFYYKPLLTWSQVFDLEDVVIMTACASGILSHRNYVALVKRFVNRFGNDFFFETQPMLRWEPQNIVFRRALDLSRKTGIPIIATNDVHYLKAKDAFAHEAALAIGQRQLWSDPKRFKFDIKGLYLKSTDEMLKTLVREDCPERFAAEMLENSLIAADLCSFEIPKTDVDLPIPERFANSDKSSERLLKEIAYDGLDDLGLRGKPGYEERLEHEINEVCSLGFAKYFLVLTDLIWWCKEVDLMVGPARGSVGGSLLSYCLGITQIDSLKYNLSFERFISPGRIDLPDIDVDFQDDRRDEIINYLRKQYGSENVLQVRTFAEMHGRQALRDAARVFGVSNEETGRAAKSIIKRSGGDAREDYSIEDAFSLFEECKEYKKKYPNVVEVAKTLEGVIRQGGIHAAGVVVSKESLYNGERCVVIRAKDGVNCVNWDKRDLDDFGLMKLDVLGLSTLSMLHRARQMIKKNHDIDFDYEDLPLDDEKILDNFRKGNTVGVFQFGTPGLSVFCREIGIDDFETLVAVNALWRPGTLKSGMTNEYKEIKNKRQQVQKVSEFYDKITESTYGIMLYQEQIMQVLFQGAGIGWRTVDTIRKAISKSEGTEKIAGFKKEFMDGCLKLGTMDEQEAARVFDKMVFFGSYGFNRSHSVAYTMLGYWTMWLKVYYPTEFYWALINYQGADKRMEYTDDARKNGIKILLPDINCSEENWTIESEGVLRAGLTSITSLSERSASEILRARSEDGKYKFSSLDDFLNRVKRRVVNKRVVQNLGKSGALRCIDVGVLSSQNIDAVLAGEYNQDEDEKSDVVLRTVGDVIDFSPSDDPLYKISALVKRIRDKFEICEVRDVLNKKLSGSCYFVGHVDKVKFGYRDRVTTAAGNRSYGGDLTGAYGNFFDGRNHIMLTFDTRLTHASKDLNLKKKIEAAENCWVLLNTNVITSNRDSKLLAKDIIFLEELIEETNLDLFPVMHIGSKKNVHFDKGLLNCSECSLRLGCKNPVMPSVGKYNVMVVAEAPGKKEDEKGSVLIGSAGKVLWDELAKYKIPRSSLYVNNVVKCRPPDNKLPSIIYAHKCGSIWLEKEMRTVDPVVVLALGATAGDFFIRNCKITELSGKVMWNTKYGCWVVYCLHPAATLYEARKKGEFSLAISRFADLLGKLYK